MRPEEVSGEIIEVTPFVVSLFKWRYQKRSILHPHFQIWFWAEKYDFSSLLQSLVLEFARKLQLLPLFSRQCACASQLSHASFWVFFPFSPGAPTQTTFFPDGTSVVVSREALARVRGSSCSTLATSLTPITHAEIFKYSNPDPNDALHCQGGQSLLEQASPIFHHTQPPFPFAVGSPSPSSIAAAGGWSPASDRSSADGCLPSSPDSEELPNIPSLPGRHFTFYLSWEKNRNVWKERLKNTEGRDWTFHAHSLHQSKLMKPVRLKRPVSVLCFFQSFLPNVTI